MSGEKSESTGSESSTEGEGKAATVIFDFQGSRTVKQKFPVSTRLQVAFDALVAAGEGGEGTVFRTGSVPPMFNFPYFTHRWRALNLVISNVFKSLPTDRNAGLKNCSSVAAGLCGWESDSFGCVIRDAVRKRLT